METTSPRIPSFDLDVALLPPAQRVEAWRATFSRFYELPEASAELEAKGRVLRLGGAVLTDTVQPKHFIRDPATARRDGADDLLISVEISGGFAMETKRGFQNVEEGRVTLFDVARPVVKRGPAGRTLVLGVARDLVEQVLPGRDLHGLTLDRGDLLVEHMHTLRRHLPDAPLAAAPHLVRSTVELLAACLAPTGDHLERARPLLVDALLSRARRHIRARHHDPRLSPGEVAAALGVSRTSLYRAFEAEGGVAEFIRRARLEAARTALEDPGDWRRIGEIAFAHGFSSEAQFSRAIRSTFGASPSQLRRRS